MNQAEETYIEVDLTFADRCKAQPSLIQPMIDHMLNAALSVDDRYNAASNLTWSFIGPRMWHERISRAFCAVLAKPTEAPALRGQAGEGLAEMYDCRFVQNYGRTRQYRRAGELLIAMLSDPSAEVRFWSCFALGKMRYHPALRALHALANKDMTEHGRWWTVGEEAADAIDWMKGRSTPDRELRR